MKRLELIVRLLHGSRWAPAWMSLLLLFTGGLYGALLAHYQRSLGGELQGVPIERFSDMMLYGGNILSGVLIAMVFHGGVTLLMWLMARAVGGPGHLGALYRVAAYILPLTYPALPYLALKSATETSSAISTSASGGSLMVMAGLSLFLLVPGLYAALRVTQGLGAVRSAVATGLFSLFCLSIVVAI